MLLLPTLNSNQVALLLFTLIAIANSYYEMTSYIFGIFGLSLILLPAHQMKVSIGHLAGKDLVCAVEWPKECLAHSLLLSQSHQAGSKYMNTFFQTPT